IEAPEDVAKRVGEALREIADATPGGTTVVVTHGGAARYGVFELLDWPQSRLGGMAVLSNCHYTELNVDPVRGWVLRAHNIGAMEGAPGCESGGTGGGPGNVRPGMRTRFVPVVAVAAALLVGCGETAEPATSPRSETSVASATSPPSASPSEAPASLRPTPSTSRGDVTVTGRIVEGV